MQRIIFITLICFFCGLFQANARPPLNDWVGSPIANGERQSFTCPSCGGPEIVLCCDDGPTTSWRCSCNAGYKSTDDTATCACVPCGAGYYSSAENISTSCRGCAIGTYNASAAAAACTSCASATGYASATTATGASTSAANCYIPSGVTGGDSSGNFEYAANCYYSY